MRIVRDVISYFDEREREGEGEGEGGCTVTLWQEKEVVPACPRVMHASCLRVSCSVVLTFFFFFIFIISYY